jgi:hypothetical protein
MAVMATSMCANTATAASSLLQRSSVIRSTELTPGSKLANLSLRQPKPLRSWAQGDVRNGGSRSNGNAAVRATLTAYRDLDSVSVSASVSVGLGVLDSDVKFWVSEMRILRRLLQEPSRESDSQESTSTTELLCCPICFQPLTRSGPSGLTQ